MASPCTFAIRHHPVKLVALVFICKLMTSTCQQFNCTGSSSEFKCFSEGLNGQCIPRIQICNSIPDCFDGSDETKVTCPDGLAPSSWADYWHPHRNGTKLSLVNIDDNVAVYWDWKGKTYENFTWLFRLVSSAWKYAKDSYGPIGNGPNPLLYVVLHTNETESCLTYTSLSSDAGFRNQIDCSLPTNSTPLAYNSANFQTMVHSIGGLISYAAKGISNNAGQGICGDIMRYIIEYDIYLKSQGTSADVISWRQRNMNLSYNGNFCFKNWYLPIYGNFGGVGGVRVLNNFYTLTNSRWPKQRQNRYTSMNLGEFVHFWSESAGTNLHPLALNAFEWDENSNLILAGARKSYIFEVNVAQTLQYTDNDVGIYFKNYPIYPNSTYKTISNAWKHVKSNYVFAKRSKSAPNKIISYYNEKLSSHHTHKRCSSITNSIITADRQARDHLYVIDCVASSNENFYKDTGGSAFIEKIIMEIGQMALNVTGGLEPESWPAFNVSGSTMASIVVYDIYKALGMSLQADEWEAKVDKLEPSPRPDKYWFRDWYKTIYNKQSNQRGKTNVLKEFLFLVSNRTSGLQINLGEFVHFWSMAAKMDLQELATLYLGWNKTHQTEFVQARKDYPSHDYYCDKCDQLPTTENYKPAESQEGNLIPIIAGVSAVGVALLILGFGIKIYLDRKKIKSLKEQVRNLSDEEVDEFYKGNPNLVGTDTHAPIQAMPFNMNYEIPRERLNIDDKKVLGSGEFGLVKQGLLKGDPSSGRPDTTVAVKMVKPSMDVVYFKAHLSEIKIMAFLGKHENIASLVGAVTTNIKNGEVFVAMEFCAKGDLLRHLKDNGKNFVDLFRKRKAAAKAAEKQVVQATYTNAPKPQCTYTNVPAPAAVVQIEPNTSGGLSGSGPSNHKNSRISTLNLLQWSRQIANGMAFLKAKHVIHGDLAARNVLIGSNDIAKISDFGLSRQLVNYSNYKKTNTETPLPWRWLAIESLENMIFSPQSDVWAFGVTLWEIFTLGKIPYPGKTWNQEFIDGLMAGQLLPSPTLGNQEVYNIILSCMKAEPSERISLPEIISQLETVEVNLSYF